MSRPARPTILVTGATGKTGAAVVAELRARDWPVRAVVRARDARSAALEAMGAAVVVADLFDPESLLAAMRGAARAYYVAPFDLRRGDPAVAFADAAREARLEAVVGLSQWLASPDHPSTLTRHHHRADRLLAALPGVAHTTVNPGYFADNYLRPIGLAAQLGAFPSLTGDSRNAPPSNEDIARVSAAALADPDRHAGRAYRPTGPALLSTADMAAIVGGVLGRTVRRAEMPWWLFARAARLLGASVAELSGLRYYAEDHRQGAFALGAPTDDVRAVTGRAPEDFATIARRYAARPEARRTAANRARAWGDFLRTPLVPAFDLDGYERAAAQAAGLPAPAVPRYAMQDPAWRAAHEAQVAGSLLAEPPVAHAPDAGARAGLGARAAAEAAARPAQTRAAGVR